MQVDITTCDGCGREISSYEVVGEMRLIYGNHRSQYKVADLCHSCCEAIPGRSPRP